MNITNVAIPMNYDCLFEIESYYNSEIIYSSNPPISTNNNSMWYRNRLHETGEDAAINIAPTISSLSQINHRSNINATNKQDYHFVKEYICSDKMSNNEKRFLLY